MKNFGRRGASSFAVHELGSRRVDRSASREAGGAWGGNLFLSRMTPVFPTATRDEGELVTRLLAIVGTGISAYSPDCIVLACNTASTVAPVRAEAELRYSDCRYGSGHKPAAQITESGLVSVLATPGTVNREYTHTLVAEFGGAAKFHCRSASSRRTFRSLCKRGPVEDDDILREIEPCFVKR